MAATPVSTARLPGPSLLLNSTNPLLPRVHEPRRARLPQLPWKAKMGKDPSDTSRSTGHLANPQRYRQGEAIKSTFVAENSDMVFARQGGNYHSKICSCTGLRT
jgi:hypothetical protein